MCFTPFSGETCSECQSNMYGADCEKRCDAGNVCERGSCIGDGSCKCFPDTYRAPPELLPRVCHLAGLSSTSCAKALILVLGGKYKNYGGCSYSKQLPCYAKRYPDLVAAFGISDPNASLFDIFPVPFGIST